MHTGIINSDNFASNDNSLVSCGRAVYGMDFDSFSGRAGRIENGISLYSNFPLYIDYTSVSAVPCNMYVHICYDTLFAIRAR